MKKVFFNSIFLTACVGVLVYFYSTLPDVSGLKTRNPKRSALMVLREQEYKRKGLRLPRQQIWEPYGAISENLKKAILLGEDASFFSHKGVDVEELKEALKEDLETGSFRRGGSTITMQLARNLYLNPSKNPLRKAKEIIIAWQLEHALTKRRIFEIYLNVVEWGRNIYGAEAAARRYFGKPAADLDIIEGATLAALLPSPRNPWGKGLLHRRNVILGRFATIGYITKGEYDRAKQVPLLQRVEQADPLLPKAN